MKKISYIDFIIILGVLLALFVGLLTVKHFRQTADTQIEATAPVEFQVFLRGITVTGGDFPIKVNDNTFITIRNVPYTELSVKNVNFQPRKVLVSGGKSESVEDPAQPYLFDAVVSIKDTAKITKDGAVVGGNKIKMGLPVTLEGEKYRFNGTISDIKVTTDSDIKDDGENKQIG